MVDYSKESCLKDVTVEKWSQLTQKYIYFGHMSVGNNILGGMQDILGQQPNIAIPINSESSSEGFCHALLGGNKQPLEEITSFQSQVKHLKSPPDIAFLKFCYVDIDVATNIQQLFDAYRQMIDGLKADFTDMTFMHCTVPLTAEPQSIKETIKEMIKPLVGKTRTRDDNAKRMAFSNLLKHTFPPETIIDIALYESVTPDGRHSTKSLGGAKIPSLHAEYTTDGGHLNEIGSRRVAEQMLIRLANCVEGP